MITRHLTRLSMTTAALAASAAGLGLCAGTAHAATGAVMEVPAAGVTFNCEIAQQPVAFTTTGGTLHIVNQMQQDATGSYHFTGTISLQGVTATDGTSRGYQIVGSSWYGGNGTGPATTTVITTDEFNILGPNGKIGSIHAELDFNPDGTVTGKALGNCTPPL